LIELAVCRYGDIFGTSVEGRSKTTAERRAILQAHEQVWQEFKPQAYVPLKLPGPRNLLNSPMILYSECLCAFEHMARLVVLDIY
jgi:hypothetical protein